MVKLATIDSNIRLVVIQFLVKRDIGIVPDEVPDRRQTNKPADFVPTGGKEVLSSTKEVYLLSLLDGICPGDDSGPYELVDAWTEPRRTAGGNSMVAVRYVFCHKEHVRPNELFPEFVAKRDELIDSLVNLVEDNLWAVQGHLNPYFENDQPSGHQVLMLGCAGRKPTIDQAGNSVKVYRDGRDELGQGRGPKVYMRDIAQKIQVVESEVVLS